MPIPLRKAPGLVDYLGPRTCLPPRPSLHGCSFQRTHSVVSSHLKLWQKNTRALRVSNPAAGPNDDLLPFKISELEEVFKK